MKPLLVGETNPYGGADEFALYPSPPGCTGHRLCHLILQLDADEYLERYDRANLCVGKWRIADAREAAVGFRREVSRWTQGAFRKQGLLGLERRLQAVHNHRRGGRHSPTPERAQSHVG